MLSGQWSAVAVVARDDVLRIAPHAPVPRVSGPMSRSRSRSLTRPSFTACAQVRAVSADHLIGRVVAERSPTKCALTAEHRVGVTASSRGRCAAASRRGRRRTPGRMVVQSVVSIIALPRACSTDLLQHTGNRDRNRCSQERIRTSVVKIVSALNILAALVLVAYTAALVRRLNPRGHDPHRPPRRPRPWPRRARRLRTSWLRLSQALRERGVAMIAVERSIDAPCMRFAQKEGVPASLALATIGLPSSSPARATVPWRGRNLGRLGQRCRSAHGQRREAGDPLALRLGEAASRPKPNPLHLGKVFDPHHLRHDTRPRDLRHDLRSVRPPRAPELTAPGPELPRRAREGGRGKPRRVGCAGPGRAGPPDLVASRKPPDSTRRRRHGTRSRTRRRGGPSRARHAGLGRTAS